MDFIKVNRMIDKLKEVRLSLFRSASDLDTILRSLETDFNLGQSSEEAVEKHFGVNVPMGETPEFLRMYLAAQRNYRQNKKQAFGYDRLDEQEQEAWDELLESLKD